VERAIAYEIERQAKLLDSGGKVEQETLGWDETKQATYVQRKKESSHDYRYFPDPDLPKLKLSQIPEFSADALNKELPELPWQARERLAQLGFLQKQDIDQLVGDFELANLYSAAEKMLVKPELVKIAANFILNDIAGQKKKDPAWALPSAQYLSEVVTKYAAGELASPQAKASILTGVLTSASDNSLLPAIAQKIVDANPSVAADFKAGKEAALQFLIGQGMKESKGSANPAALKAAFTKLLSQ
jgi:aspartyl-tRNA(Asn)/glutamyl-tRNA(Gln) amidotransferase subunit B